MAEVLGISAAVVQFLDVGLRLCLKIHSLSNAVRDVPQKLKVLRSHLMQQVEVAKHIQTVIVGSSVSLNDSSEALLKALLDDQAQTMDLLLNLLDSVSNKADDGFLRRTWNGIQAVEKRKAIESACDQVESKVNLLSLWLGNTNL